MKQSNRHVSLEEDSSTASEQEFSVDTAAQVAALIEATRDETPPYKRRKLLGTTSVVGKKTASHKDDRFAFEQSSSSDRHTVDSPLILHTVTCGRGRTSDQDHTGHPSMAYYYDQPRLFAKDTKASALRGLKLIQDVRDLFYDRGDLGFVVYRRHNCEEYHEQMKSKFICIAPENIDRATSERLKPWFYTIDTELNASRPSSEEVFIIDETARQNFTNIIVRNDEISQCFDEKTAFDAPYDFFFHFQPRVEQLLASAIIDDSEVSFSDARIMTGILSYIREVCNEQWRLATNSFDQGLVTPSIQSKVFRVGEIIVNYKEGVANPYMVQDIGCRKKGQLDIECWNLDFDGGFRRNHHIITIRWSDETVSLTSLSAWPLRLDKTGLENVLEARGNEFWCCREKRLVSYQTPQNSNYEVQMTAPKFMVDIDTHRALHSGKYLDRDLFTYEALDLSADQPPDAPLKLLMPTTIPGFGFHDKKWRDLQIDFIKPVAWSADVFTRLVLKANKKELIQALVTIHLENNEATDVIEGKGAGLIMLLHGPPGTGKTLTAETVSELAKKPLYRITCGDIGTDAESVEKYLESAFYLGTIWDCVVLLDEADVFLEERTQNDLARNALVSVFLRVLEYFNGILVLTSNRVGLFDEAFKSRMQLVIRYPPLDEDGRFKIWDNFFHALHKAGTEMEFEDLSRNVKCLAQKQLNGRQIRNVIKTARQLARFRAQKFNNQHLECAIEVVEEFEQYLRDTRGSDEYYARQQRIRYE